MTIDPCSCSAAAYTTILVVEHMQVKSGLDNAKSPIRQVQVEGLGLITKSQPLRLTRLLLISLNVAAKTEEEELKTRKM